MAYGIIPDYKKETVLCQLPCKHIDCEAMREDFIRTNICLKCGGELKIGEAFCYTPEYSKYAKAHHRCLI